MGRCPYSTATAEAPRWAARAASSVAVNASVSYVKPEMLANSRIRVGGDVLRALHLSELKFVHL